MHLSFCLYGGKPNGEWSERGVANVSQRDITFAADGSFELVLSPERAPAGGANWVQLEPDAVCVISREYYTDPRGARPARFAIEAIGTVAPPAPLSDALLANRLRAVNHAQAVLESDGTFRMVIAHRDPGVPNWLDTTGHRDGLFFCRWLQAEEPPEQPACTVVPVSSLRR